MANSIHYLRICSYWKHLGMQEYTENLLVSASHAASNSHWEKQHSKYYIFIHTVIKLCLQILLDSHLSVLLYFAAMTATFNFSVICHIFFYPTLKTYCPCWSYVWLFQIKRKKKRRDAKQGDRNRIRHWPCSVNHRPHVAIVLVCVNICGKKSSV